MVTNPHILEEFERKEKRAKGPSHSDSDWYKKADDLYKLALEINPELGTAENEKHLEMLIEMKKKIDSIANKT